MKLLFNLLDNDIKYSVKKGASRDNSNNRDIFLICCDERQGYFQAKNDTVDGLRSKTRFGQEKKYFVIKYVYYLF